MSMSISSYAVAGVVVSVTALAGYLVSKTSAPATKARSVGAKLPPGPKQNPFVGNLTNFPQERWYQNFTEWEKQFGDLVFINLNVAGVTILIVNSLEIAEELGGRRTKNYSGRPHTTMLSDLMYLGWTLLSISPGPAFFDQIRIFQKSFSPPVIPQYDTLIQEQISELLVSLPTTSGDPFAVVSPTIGSVFVKIAYGKEYHAKHGQELMRNSLEIMDLAAVTMTKFWAVDIFPFLRHIPVWFPGAYFRRVSAYATELGKRIRFEPTNFVTKRMAEGAADESMISKFYNDPTVMPENVRDITVTTMSASSDTTATSITHFLYAMALHPECQKKVHDELDAVIGNGRAPSFDEVKDVPYFNAAWLEALRLNPAAPLGLPHTTLEDDVWNGYFIPKGCIVNFNIGFMMRDPRIWGEDSNSYRPERLLEKHARDLKSHLSLTFGFGRRTCPGRFMAQRITMQIAAAVLSAFEVVAMDTDDGQTLTEANTTYHEDTIRRIANFRCRYVPRHI